MRSGRHQQPYSTWRSRPPASRGSPTAQGTRPCGCSTTPHTCADRHLRLKSVVRVRGLRFTRAYIRTDSAFEDDRCPDGEGQGGQEVGTAQKMVGGTPAVLAALTVGQRSEERRVGKECRSRWSP